VAVPVPSSPPMSNPMEGAPVKSSRLLLLVALALVSLVAAACGDSGGTGGGSGGGGEKASAGSKLAGTIRIDGSSTVGPLSEAAAEAFQGQSPGVKVTVGTSGTGGGFEKFCAGETDISDASREIKPEEADACKAKGIKYEAFQVANDGIAVVVNKDNTFAKCLTPAQLKKIWDKGSKVKDWKQIDPKFPGDKLELFGPGTDSGTFDFFTKEINGEEDQSRSDYNATEDDNVIVRGIEGSKGGLGYFGLSYYEQNKDKLNVVQVNDGKGCVTPSTATVQDGTYSPLSRPLFIYVKSTSVKKPEVKGFVEYYLENTDALTKQALFVPLTSEQESSLKPKLDKLQKTA
jgi:phosphate transport system substrate-binding protein